MKINQIHNINKKKDFIIGIGFLRVILSFMVIMDHLYDKNKLRKYHYILYYHIPTFFLISFYFTYRTLISFNIEKLKSRLERIIIPYFSWSTISWILKNIYFYILKRECRHSFLDYIINLINGHILLVPLWFQNILILITLAFIIIIFLFKNNFIIIFHILGILAIVSQYSEFNYNFFKKKFDVHTRLTYGRFAESFPNAVIGFSLAHYEFIRIIKNKKYILYYWSIILILITKYNIFSDLKTFKYGGIRLSIAANCIFIIFSLFPFQKLKNKYIINGFIKITNYTAGIYFTHYLIGKGYICKSILHIKYFNILGCIIIYIISYLISMIGSKLLGKTKFRHLFI